MISVPVRGANHDSLTSSRTVTATAEKVELFTTNRNLQVEVERGRPGDEMDTLSREIAPVVAFLAPPSRPPADISKAREMLHDVHSTRVPGHVERSMLFFQQIWCDRSAIGEH